MPRALIVFASAVTLVVAGLLNLPSAAAQPGICITLPAGDHELTAAARDREGNVTFRLTVGDGGAVNEFIEPGGQSIPPIAMLDIFAGEDPYPLPDGVAIVDCPWMGNAAASNDEDEVDATQGDAAPEAVAPTTEPAFCISLEPGSYTETVSAGGRSYDVTINVTQGRRITDVEILGRSYSAPEALGLLSGFGASLPEHFDVQPCAASYPQTGSGGLADSGSVRDTALAVLAAIASVTIAASIAHRIRRRRV